MNRIPYNSLAHTEILVHVDVSHSTNLLPFNIRGERSNFAGNIPRGFSNNQNSVDDSIYGLLIVQELFEGHAFSVPFNSQYCRKHILDAKTPVSRRYESPHAIFCP